jgi:hypothetical protein
MLALMPEQVASPLAGRPYDLRHGVVSLWLNGGVAATEVANRAGHSVEVLLRVYAKCIDGGNWLHLAAVGDERATYDEPVYDQVKTAFARSSGGRGIRTHEDASTP